eukprot:scaffold30866_cov19-Tisochrysis_lutea.AAC.3
MALEGGRAGVRGAGGNGRKGSESHTLLGSGGGLQGRYYELLTELDRVVGHEVDAALQVGFPA